MSQLVHPTSLYHRLYRTALRDAFRQPQYDIWCYPGVWHPAEVVSIDLAGVTLTCTVCTIDSWKISPGEWVFLVRKRPRAREEAVTATSQLPCESPGCCDKGN